MYSKNILNFNYYYRLLSKDSNHWNTPPLTFYDYSTENNILLPGVLHTDIDMKYII